MTVNPLYLSRLGLGKDHQGQASPEGTSTDGGRVKAFGQPVIASSVEKEKLEDAVAFMESVTKHMSGYHLVMFDLSSSESFHVLVSESLCVLCVFACVCVCVCVCACVCVCVCHDNRNLNLFGFMYIKCTLGTCNSFIKC